MGELSQLLATVDTSVPHAARFWDYLLGGKNNFQVDREAGRRVLEVFPQLRDSAGADRRFLRRSVTHLVRDRGIRQLLDVGAGLPTVDNTHEVAQRLVPDCRVVYVDNDPMVLAHARAVLTSTPQGLVDYVRADVRDAAGILREAARTLEPARPVALMMLGVINYVLDDAEAHTSVAALVDALAPGSFLVISHPTAELHADAITASIRLYNETGAAPLRSRSPAELARFLDGLELLDPGVVSCSRWRPDVDESADSAEVTQYCAVARKP